MRKWHKKGIVVAAYVLLVQGCGGEKQPEARPAEPERKTSRSSALASNSFVEPPAEEEPAQPAPQEPSTKKPGSKKQAVVKNLWDCEGEVDQKSARQAISAHEKEVRNCYEHALRTDNLLEGVLKVGVRVEAGGKVSDVRMGGTLRDKGVQTCVKALAVQWSFSAPSGGECAVLEIPFNLTPSH